jgi:hypothetical protein
MIPCATPEQKLRLLAALEELDNTDEGPACLYDEDSAEGVWAYTEEWGDVERLVEVVAAWQTSCHVADPWILTWAETCDKPRLDEFSGGAVAVFKGECHWVVPGQECIEWIAEQRKKGAA